MSSLSSSSSSSTSSTTSRYLTGGIVIYNHHHLDRYVISKTASDLVYKVQVNADKEDKIAPLLAELDPDNNRFGWFTKPAFGEISREDLVHCYPSIIAPEAAKFQIRVSPNQGKSLEELLYNPRICSSCIAEPSTGKMKINSDHVPRFIIHLIESCILLDNAGIDHNDLRLANILVKPTPKELEEGVLTESLPRIIDFGESVIGKKATSNLNDFIAMFVTCVHGSQYLESKARDDECKEDEPNWLTRASTAITSITWYFNKFATNRPLSFKRLIEHIKEVTGSNVSSLSSSLSSSSSSTSISRVVPTLVGGSKKRKRPEIRDKLLAVISELKEEDFHESIDGITPQEVLEYFEDIIAHRNKKPLIPLLSSSSSNEKKRAMDSKEIRLGETRLRCPWPQGTNESEEFRGVYYYDDLMRYPDADILVHEWRDAVDKVCKDLHGKSYREAQMIIDSKFDAIINEIKETRTSYSSDKLRLLDEQFARKHENCNDDKDIWVCKHSSDHVPIGAPRCCDRCYAGVYGISPPHGGWK